MEVNAFLFAVLRVYSSAWGTGVKERSFLKHSVLKEIGSTYEVKLKIMDVNEASRKYSMFCLKELEITKE
jgi:hypothetical protein